MPKHAVHNSFLLTPKSSNHKTGKMAVSTSPPRTCPSACPFINHGCYADYGPVKIWWKACGEFDGNPSTEYASLLERVRALPAGSFFRHNQAGDLVGESSTRIDHQAALALVSSTECLRAYTYTHYPVLDGDDPQASEVAVVENRKVIESMNALGLTVNISANSILHADRVIASGLKAPVTTVLPQMYESQDKAIITPGGNRLIVCPNVTRGRTCTECGLCMRVNRRAIVGFPAHGTGKRHCESVFDKWTRETPVPVSSECPHCDFHDPECSNCGLKV